MLEKALKEHIEKQHPNILVYYYKQTLELYPRRHNSKSIYAVIDCQQNNATLTTYEDNKTPEGHTTETITQNIIDLNEPNSLQTLSTHINKWITNTSKNTTQT